MCLGNNVTTECFFSFYLTWCFILILTRSKSLVTVHSHRKKQQRLHSLPYESLKRSARPQVRAAQQIKLHFGAQAALGLSYAVLLGKGNSCISKVAVLKLSLGTFSQTLQDFATARRPSQLCRLCTTDNCRHFITPTVHFCVQYGGHKTSRGFFALCN